MDVLMHFLRKRDASLLLGATAAVSLSAAALYLWRASSGDDRAPTAASRHTLQAFIGPADESEAASCPLKDVQQAESPAAQPFASVHSDSSLLEEPLVEDDATSEAVSDADDTGSDTSKPDINVDAVVSCTVAQSPATTKDASAIPPTAAAHDNVSDEARDDGKHAVMILEQAVLDETIDKVQHADHDEQLPTTVPQDGPEQEGIERQNQQHEQLSQPAVERQLAQQQQEQELAAQQEQLPGDAACSLAQQSDASYQQRDAQQAAGKQSEEQAVDDELLLCSENGASEPSDDVADDMQQTQQELEASPFAVQQKQLSKQHSSTELAIDTTDEIEQNHGSAALSVQQVAAVEHEQAAATAAPVSQDSLAADEQHPIVKEVQHVAVMQPQQQADKKLVTSGRQQQQQPCDSQQQAAGQHQQAEQQVQQPAEDSAAAMTSHPSQPPPTSDLQELQQAAVLKEETTSAHATMPKRQEPQQDGSKVAKRQRTTEPQQQTAQATPKVPPLPLQKLQQPREQPLKLTNSMPSERDRAIMYRLSIDKSAMDGTANSSKSSSPRKSMELSGSPTAQHAPAMVKVHSARSASGVISAYEGLLNRQASQGIPMSPRSGANSPRVSGAMKMRHSINTARNQPSIDDTVASAAVARSLSVQYAENRTSIGAADKQGMRCLSSWCATLCKQHCKKLYEPSGDFGETTALDIGCGTGGTCFELAMSFSHVLGIDGDAMHVVAAKEMRDKGKLDYRPAADGAVEDTPNSSSSNINRSSTDGSRGHFQSGVDSPRPRQSGVQTARVSAFCDRDKVRFWCYPLPELPPKLQPVDAILVEDVEGRLGQGLGQVCQQLPALLKPGGVCVIVLPGVAANGHPNMQGKDMEEYKAEDCKESEHVSIQQVEGWLAEHGLQFVTQQEFQYHIAASEAVQVARAGVWLLPR